MASAASTHLLLTLFLSFALLTLSDVKPSIPPPATVHPPTSPANPYTPPPSTSPVKPYPPKAPLPPPSAVPVPPVSSPVPPPSKAPHPQPQPPVASPPTTYRPPVKKQECVPLCEARCGLHSRKRVCVRACSTCCERCKCVPPGTSGNRQLCGTCWTDMRTHGNRYKCP